MLVLSRKETETVVITAGDQRIYVTLVEIRGDKCRLGFVADPSVTIHRSEVQQLIEQQGSTRPGEVA